jgi:hypothetical protein
VGGVTREKAYRLAEHYLLTLPSSARGRPFDADNRVEVRELIDEIIEQAKAEMRDELRTSWGPTGGKR